MIDADVLLARRTERGLSQRKLGNLAGVNGMTILRISTAATRPRSPSPSSDASPKPSTSILPISSSVDVTPAPVAAAPPSDLDSAPLDHNAARLLRRIHRGDDIRRTMSRADREITLPALINRGLVRMTATGAVLDPDVAASLQHPDI